MTLVIGIDEAGYGPNLGPLVIGGSLWRVGTEQEPATTAAAESRLATFATALADEQARDGLLWGDSKKIFNRQRGEAAALAALERGVLAALVTATDSLPAAGADLLARLELTLPADAAGCCWQSLASTALPSAATADACRDAATAAGDSLARQQIELLAVACRWVFPEAFNAGLDRGLNKSDLLSQASLDLAADLRRHDPTAAASICCDRHGGRKRYAGVVSHCFAAARVEPLNETAAYSRYLIHADGPSTSISFNVGGEALLPVAVASMTAKYVRELAMAAFNRFWASYSPAVRPTAGYPLDALRWWQESAAVRQQLMIPDQALWRRA